MTRSLTFGEYVKVYNVSSVTNTNEERTTSAVALYPSGNLQGGWMFFLLNTDRVLHRHQWKRLPINNQITNRIYNMATKEGQQYISSNFKYKWNTDSEDDTVRVDTEVSVEALTSDDNDAGGQTDTPLDFHEIADEVNEIIADAESPIIEEVNPCGDQTPDSVAKTANDSANFDNEQTPEQIQSGNIDIPTNNPESDDDNEDSTSVGNDTKEGTHSGTETITDKVNAEQFNDEASNIESEVRYNLRARANVNYKHMHKYGETQLIQIHQDWIND